MARRRTSRSINAKRREALVVRVMKVLDQHNNTVFEFEGACRHRVRAQLCLEGWEWQTADQFATEVVAAALNRLGAKRPTWAQGQPRWTEEGYVFIKRTRCINCARKLPEGHRLYCNRVCGQSHLEREYRRQLKAGELAWALERREVLGCLNCGRPFPHYAERGRKSSFCSVACHVRYKRTYRSAG